MKVLLVFLTCGLAAAAAGAAEWHAFLETHCFECHDRETAKGGLDLESQPPDFTDPESWARWLKVHDRVQSGEMPPASRERPHPGTATAFLQALAGPLAAAEQARLGDQGRTRLRRLTRGEYENTIRDLFDLPGLDVAGLLPADGSAHGFDTNADALDLSHVSIAAYTEAADRVLDLAIATQPAPPSVWTQRLSLAEPGGFVAHVLLNGDGVLLRDMMPDPEFPPAGEHAHLDEGAHEAMGTFSRGSTVGLFRHEDEAFSPYFAAHVTRYPGRYHVRWSVWSFQWDKGVVRPGRGSEAARLSVVQLTGDGRGGQHPSETLGYFEAPSLRPTVHELSVWMNHNQIFGFNAASLAPVANYARPGRAMAFTGPGIAVDWLEVSGPHHDLWPPRAHTRLFGSLPLAAWSPENHGTARPPARPRVRIIGAGKNQPDPDPGLWSVTSRNPLADAESLLASFLPRAFRRPVDPETRDAYLGLVRTRLDQGDCFESALRWAYRAALCSPDFLHHVEPAGPLDDFALACRLSYFLWNSAPDDRLTDLAATGRLRAEWRNEVERLLHDPKAQRFIDDFTGQWLKLRSIAANDPDRRLYPEFNLYLQDSMVAETRATFRELLERDLDATHLVRSDFVMINEKLAAHYGIPGVSGPQIRRVPLPADSPRGGFLTQAAVLKVTANGTTTSPVPRGAFVLARLLGQPPDPPPPNTPAVEPDVRGTTTIREQLERHRADPACAGCHARMDPPGFALEAFDVIGGFRTRYRSIGAGDPPERGSIDPLIPLGFTLGPAVDPAGQWPDGRQFHDIRDFRSQLAENPRPLTLNLARQLLTYATGRPVSFSDRPELDSLISRTLEQGGGLRSLIHELTASPLFQTR